jgi:hypothetical protein
MAAIKFPLDERDIRTASDRLGSEVERLEVAGARHRPRPADNKIGIESAAGGAAQPARPFNDGGCLAIGVPAGFAPNE